MSTSLNDVVFELYRELQEQKDLAASSPSGLKRLYREPSLLLRYLRYFFTDYGRQCLHTRKIIAQRRSKQNIFTPTQKVYPGTRIAIYTAVTGQYEDIKDPIYIDDDIDYYAFTDAEITYRGGGVFGKKLCCPHRLVLWTAREKTDTLSCDLGSFCQKKNTTTQFTLTAASG